MLRSLVGSEMCIRDSLNDVPEGVTVVTESGLLTPGDMRMMLDNAVSTFLIGESFMRQPSPGEALATMVSGAQA